MVVGLLAVIKNIKPLIDVRYIVKRVVKIDKFGFRDVKC